jgi:methyl-accepting chemotaxis protein
MSTMANELTEMVVGAQNALGAIAAPLAAMPQGPNQIDIQSTLSNTELLLGTLAVFYSDQEKARYFPLCADVAVKTALEALSKRMTEFAGNNHQTHVATFLSAADQLYAICIQYGLITFGFPQKELSELIVDLRTRKRTISKTAERVARDAATILSAAEEHSREAKERFSNETEELRASLESALKKCEEFQLQLQASSDAMTKGLEEFKAQHASVTAMAESLAKSDKATSLLATEVEEMARTVRTELEAVKDHRARIKDEMDAILAFYSEIEEHQKTMRDTQKEATAKHNELVQKYEEEQSRLKARTDEIVVRNEGLQKEIKGHLSKAVGVTLFSAFDQRRRGLLHGKVWWAVIMLLSAGAGAGLSWWLAESIKAAGGGFEPAFFVKLSAVIPISFAIVFAARQYSNERRTEEEYAFKSAISVSLEPYKDLLKRMKEEGHMAEAGFVEKLLMEVFDNPVRRVYADKHPTINDPANLPENLLKMPEVKRILAFSKDFDPDKARKAIELIGDIMGRPLIHRSSKNVDDDQG